MRPTDGRAEPTSEQQPAATVVDTDPISASTRAVMDLEHNTATDTDPISALDRAVMDLEHNTATDTDPISALDRAVMELEHNGRSGE